MKHEIIFIAGDSKLNSFMKVADLFEDGKVLGVVSKISFTTSTRCTKNYISKMIEQTKKGLESSGYIVSLVHFKNQNKVVPYINKEVRVISDGKRYTMFDDILRRMGFSVETNQHRFIKSISY